MASEMIVNTASKCGLTPQYKDLEAIYKKYKNRNFVIIGYLLGFQIEKMRIQRWFVDPFPYFKFVFQTNEEVI